MFVDLLRDFDDSVSILDLGGTADFWAKHGDFLPRSLDVRVTVANRQPVTDAATERVSFVRADARNLSQFGDEEFDLCFSNSVIEHVGSFDDQTRMAREIRRVATGHFVQTPNRYFPIEPHFLVPGWQFLPVGLRVAVLRRTSVGWMRRQADPEIARGRVVGVRLLDRREFTALFPTSEIRVERVGPLVKSWIAVQPPPDSLTY